MNPSSGDIYAMANYPYYDLNDPFNAEPTGLSSTWDSLSTEEKTKSLNAVWRNKAVCDGYEPGSTFKLITTSIALEEGLAQTDKENDFYCSGVETVADEEMECWRHGRPHYGQSLRDALKNSCNPSFIQLGQRIGVPLFYKYLNAFGLLNKTNAGFAGEANSIFYPEENMGPVELATMSFGQRFTVTPLQLITAVSAIANDGVLVKPKIISKIENTDTKEITTVETEEIRQVISKQTAKTVKELMESVVLDGTGQNAKIDGYSIGGKSGTSEPRRGKEEDGYIASFIALSPVENTQIVCLVIIYKPSGGKYQGGQVAAPIVNQILKEVLPHLGITSSTEAGESEELYDTKILVNLKGKTVAEARTILESNGFKVQYSSDEDENSAIVTEQSPKGGSFLIDGATVCLYSENSEEKIYQVIPNLKGLTAAQAISSLKAKNLNINIEGTEGIVISQSPSYDTEIEEGSIINIVIKEELVDGQ